MRRTHASAETSGSGTIDAAGIADQEYHVGGGQKKQAKVNQ